MSGNEEERLQKYLAAMGVASRRACEHLIAEGRVQVNGETVTIPGTKIIPGTDTVAVDGRVLSDAPRLRYILLYKPVGYICSAADEKDRRTVLDLLEGVEERVYPVGRLDYDTSGALLLTNDGELTNRLLHPSHEVEKTYLAQVEGEPEQKALERLRKGVRLSDGMTAPAKVRRKHSRDGRFWLELTIHEGRNRQVRRMLEAVGHPVLHLKRTKLDFLDLTGLSPGTWRELTVDEVRRLKRV
ncbi:MAG: rRNA pseudouridine synthase [Firmicutes bacterium]|nr:rRNA pseudouridine synthase [Bacillota bacterium]